VGVTWETLTPHCNQHIRMQTARDKSTLGHTDIGSGFTLNGGKWGLGLTLRVNPNPKG